MDRYILRAYTFERWGSNINVILIIALHAHYFSAEGLHLVLSSDDFKCMIYTIFLYIWPAVVKDIEVTLGHVHITWDTTGEEVTLELEKDINIEKVTKDL